MSPRKRKQAERRRLKVHYGRLYDEVAAILFELDPIGINFGSNTDEYESETGTIIPRLHLCHCVADARKVIHEEFVRWFSHVNVGAECDYQEAAERIWSAWQRYRPEPPPDFGLSPPFIVPQ